MTKRTIQDMSATELVERLKRGKRVRKTDEEELAEVQARLDKAVELLGYWMDHESVSWSDAKWATETFLRSLERRDG